MRSIDGRSPGLPKLELVASARLVADHASQGHISEDFAVQYLAENAAQSDVAYIEDAVIRAKQDADLLPLAVALLERALDRARHPPLQPRARRLPDAGPLRQPD